MVGKLHQQDKDLRHFISMPWLILFLLPCVLTEGLGTIWSFSDYVLLHFSFYIQVSLYNASYRTAWIYFYFNFIYLKKNHHPNMPVEASTEIIPTFYCSCDWRHALFRFHLCLLSCSGCLPYLSRTKLTQLVPASSHISCSTLNPLVEGNVTQKSRDMWCDPHMHSYSWL